MMMQRVMAAPLPRFLIVGGLSTVINYLVFLALFSNGWLDYVAASAVGFLSGVAFGYVLNKRWTFGVKAPSTPGIVVRYLAVYLASLCMGLMVIHALVTFANVDPLIANAVSIVFTTCTNFIGTRYMVFRA